MNRKILAIVACAGCVIVCLLIGWIIQGRQLLSQRKIAVWLLDVKVAAKGGGAVPANLRAGDTGSAGYDGVLFAQVQFGSNRCRVIVVCFDTFQVKELKYVVEAYGFYPAELSKYWQRLDGGYVYAEFDTPLQVEMIPLEERP